MDSNYIVLVMKDNAFAGVCHPDTEREFGTLLSAGDTFPQIANYEDKSGTVTFDDLDTGLSYACSSGTVVLLAAVPLFESPGLPQIRWKEPPGSVWQNFCWN
jgi:hypothetical protein